MEVYKTFKPEYKTLFDAVVKELSSDYNTIENASKVFKRQIYYNRVEGYPQRKYDKIDVMYGIGCGFSRNMYTYHCIFGWYRFYGGSDLTLLHKMDLPKMDLHPDEYSHLMNRKMERCGIELLDRPHQNTEDGRYTHKGYLKSNLKKWRKINGIKGNLSYDKIIQALMKC